MERAGKSIKINELLPKLRAGDNPIGGQGLAIKRNGRDIDVWDIDWNTANISEYHIYQPPGETNVLGVVKFLFPNKHSVYLHDTPAKKLFNEKVRMFSHGCMRVRNPVQLAEVIMSEDKGWDKNKIHDMAYDGPPDNDIALDTPIPVHVTYFTAWVDDTGKLKTFADVYGHQKRIILGLEGRWSEIVKNRDHLLPPMPTRPRSQATATIGATMATTRSAHRCAASARHASPIGRRRHRRSTENRNSRSRSAISCSRFSAASEGCLVPDLPSRRRIIRPPVLRLLDPAVSTPALLSPFSRRLDLSFDGYAVLRVRG